MRNKKNLMLVASMGIVGVSLAGCGNDVAVPSDGPGDVVEKVANNEENPKVAVMKGLAAYDQATEGTFVVRADGDFSSLVEDAKDPQAQSAIKMLSDASVKVEYKLKSGVNDFTLDPMKNDYQVTVNTGGTDLLNVMAVYNNFYVKADIQPFLANSPDIPQSSIDQMKTQGPKWMQALLNGEWLQLDPSLMNTLSQQMNTTMKDADMSNMNDLGAAFSKHSTFAWAGDNVVKVTVDAKPFIAEMEKKMDTKKIAGKNGNKKMSAMLNNNAKIEALVTIDNGKVVKIDTDFASLVTNMNNKGLSEKNKQKLANTDFGIVLELSDKSGSFAAPENSVLVTQQDLAMLMSAMG